MRKEKSKSGKVKMRNKALFIGIIGIVAIVLAVAAIGANANNNTEASDKVNVPDVPHKINYQGYLTDTDDNPITGDRDMTFKIYDSPTGGTQLWSETQTSVRVENGLFNVILGSVNPIPGDVFPSGGSRWLETEIEDQPLTPRKEIVSVAYAFKAGTAAPPCWDCVSTPPPGITWLQTLTHRVGIGTTNPNVKLHVLDDLTDAHHPSILIEKTSTNTLSPRLGMKEVGAPVVWFIDNCRDQFRIYRQPSIGTQGDQCLLIDNQCRVGIGTDEPIKRLDVRGTLFAGESVAGGVGISIEDTTIKPANVPGIPERLFSDLHLDSMYGVGNGHVILAESGGNVGIGTTMPALPLHVEGDGSNSAAFMNGNVGIGTTTPQNKLDVEGAVAIGTDYSGTATAPTDGMIIEGKVGIGTASVDVNAKFEVEGGSVYITDNYPILTFNNKGGTGPDIWIASSNFNPPAGDFMIYQTSPASRRILSYYLLGPKLALMADGGNVGIGTTSPENKLHVSGAINLDPIPAPNNPSSGFVIYVDSADGKLKAKASTGTVTDLAIP